MHVQMPHYQQMQREKGSCREVLKEAGEGQAHQREGAAVQAVQKAAALMVAYHCGAITKQSAPAQPLQAGPNHHPVVQLQYWV